MHQENLHTLYSLLSWHHSGFNVYLGDRIEPEDKDGLGNLAIYIIRACFSQERMVYVPAEKCDDGVAKVIYTSKDGKTREFFTALDWLARLVTHIPCRYEHMVRYYGYFSNKSRGMRKKANADDTIPAIMPNEMSSEEARRNWARLIQKIYCMEIICPSRLFFAFFNARSAITVSCTPVPDKSQMVI